MATTSTSATRSARLASFLEVLDDPRRYEWDVVHLEIIPEKPPRLAPLPEKLDPRVARLVKTAGFTSLYCHQAEAAALALEGRNVVLSTSTASGKTLAYHLPVIHRLMQDPRAHALFLFPLKALERDQRDAFLSTAARVGLSAEVYDGDTPSSLRAKIRRNPPRVLITNPDMLHVGLLAFHDSWRDFFGHLAYIVLDEVHTYKGIFGSHIAQVLWRTRRICGLYGARPQFFASSATVSDPGRFVSRLIGEEVSIVDESGAPTSERRFVFLQPQLSPNTVASRLFVAGIKSGLKTIVFTKSRKATELITTWVLSEDPDLRKRISSYRAGFLPEERRFIESQLFSGEMDGVISTSALEMGIDVGGLDLCLLVGYPGTIINTWQRGGRVGRAGRPSAVVLIAGHDALDQYFLKHPGDFFGRNCEEAVLDPRNKEVLKRHLPCAASETPILAEEPLIRESEVREVLDGLQEHGQMFQSKVDGSWHSSRRRPHRGVDLRGIGASFAISLEDGKTLIGSASGVRVFKECHVGAVYLHRAREYVVSKLDLKRRNVFVKPGKFNYYTIAQSEKDTEILGAPLDHREFPGFSVREGRLKVTERIVAYEKHRKRGQELIGTIELELPPLHFETVGIWMEIPDEVKEAVQNAGLHFMGGIHALEHAAIAMFPLFALCDRDDIGGISTPEHEQVCRAAVFIYDGHPGGVGLSHHIFGRIEELLSKTRQLVEECPCEDGCPSCIHSPKCGSGNKPLDKQACLAVLTCLLEPEKGMEALKKMETESEQPASESRGSSPTSIRKQTQRRHPIFPEMISSGEKPPKARASTTRRPSSGEGPSATGEPSPKIIPADQRNIVVFDLETQKAADEVGGWKNISKMKVSLGVAYSDAAGFVTYTEETIPELIDLLKSADLVVGFNQIRFDYEVLRAYSRENLRALPNLDILVEVHSQLGFRLSLDHLGEVTLGRKKTGHGLDAIKWFREGRMDLLEEYCREDVAITRDLYRFGLENGFLLYRPRSGPVAKIPLDWTG